MAGGRKVAAILVADVAGFSRLTGADEERTLARLRALRSDLIDPTIAIHNGRLVKRTGDGAVVEYRSVVEAVRSAIEVQSGLAARNAGIPDDQRIDVRVGIHLGDVVEEADGDLMGDGVNVAARLQAICEPSGICLSEDAWRQVRDKLHEPFVDLGEQSLKNIARPVRVYALKPNVTASDGRMASLPTAPRRSPLLRAADAVVLIVVLVAAGWLARQSFAPPSVPPPVTAVPYEKLAHAQRVSIVVLPFANLSGDPEQESFADGLADDLTTDLSHLPDSFVIGRSTAAAYKGKPVDLKQLGRDLGVRYAVEGSVRRVGDVVMINAQLVSTDTGAHIWADRFGGERGKLAEFQAGAASRLTNALRVQVVNAEALRSLRERPTNPDAADLATRGTAAANAGMTLENLDKAIGLFDEALQLDPNLPQALTGAAEARLMRLYNFGTGDWSEVLHYADQAADRVLASHADNAMAHYVKALVVDGRLETDATLTNADAAIAIDRNLARAYTVKSHVLVASGRAPEAIEPAEQALRLDPSDPERDGAEWVLCYAQAHLAHWNEAIEACGKSAAINPSFLRPYFELAASYAWIGRRDEAARAVSQLGMLRPGVTIQDYVAVQPRGNPTFVKGEERIVEGLRKAGLPETPENRPATATADASKWCAGVKIAAIVPGWPPGSPDMMSQTIYNGFRQAALDLGPSVTYSYSHWDRDVMLAELEKAVDAKVDGVVVAGHPGDAAADDLIDRAFAQGTIVTTTNMPLPEAEAKHASAGMGSVGGPNHAAGFALASEVVKRASLKAGDSVMVWGNKGKPSDFSQRSVGMMDGFEKAGVTVFYREIDPAYGRGGGDPAGTLAAVIAGIAWGFGKLAREASLKPGQVYMAGLVLTPATVQGIKDGYVSLIFDEQPYLQGYLPILNICLAKQYSFSGLDFNTLGAFIDKNSVDAVAPLVEKSIR
jgi:adenylate cyclase